MTTRSYAGGIALYLPDLDAYFQDLLRDREWLLAASDLDDWARAEATPSDDEVTRIRRLIARITPTSMTSPPRTAPTWSWPSPPCADTAASRSAPPASRPPDLDPRPERSA